MKDRWYVLVGPNFRKTFSNYDSMMNFWKKLPLSVSRQCHWDFIY